MLWSLAMKKADMKNLLYAQFEAAVARVKTNLTQLVKKREEIDAEISWIIDEFGKAHGIVGRAMLDNLHMLPPPAQAEPAAAIAKNRKIRRKRRARKPGELTIRDTLLKFLPAWLSLVGKGGREFTAREVFDTFNKSGGMDKRVELKHVSLYLAQDRKTYGVKMEARNVSRGKDANGKPYLSAPTNFFRLASDGKPDATAKQKRNPHNVLALAKGLIAGEFKGRVFTPPQLASKLKSKHGIVPGNIHSLCNKLMNLKLIKRVAKGQYQA